MVQKDAPVVFFFFLLMVKLYRMMREIQDGLRRRSDTDVHPYLERYSREDSCGLEPDGGNPLFKDAKEKCDSINLPFLQPDLLCLVKTRETKRQITVTNNSIEGIGVQVDATSLICATRHLECINGWNLRVDGIEKLSFVITEGAFPNLSVLDLSDNDIGDDGFIKFSEALFGPCSAPGRCGPMSPMSASLRELYVNNNKIGHEGMRSFCGALSKDALPNLTCLDLDENEIRAQGMAVFCENVISTGKLRNLERLNLSGNELGDEGIISFIAAVSFNSDHREFAMNGLQHLSLYTNGIGGKGMTALATAISTSTDILPKLENLYILGDQGNGANQEGQSRLLEACRLRYISVFSPD